MTNKKSTKRALLTSVMALLLCFTMLLGTTYAWFTDSVSSGRNKIVTGNLDVKLSYSTWDGTAWSDYAEVDENTKVFNENALYEPGYTEVVKFKVENVGSLSLKYNMTAMVYSEIAGTNVDGETFKLSDYIYVGKIDGNSPVDRDTAAAAATAKLGTGFNMVSNKAMSAGDTEEFILVLSMPTTVGNEANHAAGKQPSIEFGIALVAAQYIEESDDFDNKYDEDATYPVNIAITKPVNLTAENKAAEDVTFTYEDETSDISKIEITVPVDTQLDAGTTQLVLSIKEQEDVHPAVATVIKSSQTATTYEINIDGLADDNTTPVPITFYIGKNLIDVEIWHKDAKIDSTYDSATGALSFAPTGFSPFTVVHKKVEGEIYDLDELKAAFTKGGNYSLAANINVDADETIILAAGKSLVLDLNGYTISGVSDVTDKNNDGKFTSADNTILIDVRGDLTVKNGNITAKHEGDNLAWNAMHEIFYVGFDGALTLDNVKAENLGGTDMAYCIDLVNASNVTVNVNNCELTSAYIPVRVFNNGSGMNNVTIKNSTVHGENRALWVHIYTNDDNGNKGVKDSTLNFDIFNGTNKFSATKKSDAPICYGFTNAYRYDANGKFAYIEAENVAGLQGAFDNGLNVRLYNDIIVTATLNVPASKVVTLDLNEYNLSYAVSNSGATAIINNKGTLNIIGKGTISFVAENPDLQDIPSYATNTITNTGSLTIGAGVVVTNSSDGGASYAVDNHGTFVLNGGTLIGKRCALRVARYNQDNVSFVMNSGRVEAATPAWIQLPGSDSKAAPKITVEINGGTFQCTKEPSSDENNVMYTYSYGNSHANTSITINGGEFLGGVVSIGSGYKGDAPALTINGGTFEYDVIQWLENDEWKVVYEAKK